MQKRCLLFVMTILSWSVSAVSNTTNVCSFNTNHGLINTNIVRSKAVGSLCLQDRLAISGMIAARYTRTYNRDLEVVGLNSRFTLNNVNLITDFKINDHWFAHLGIADVTLEERGGDDDHQMKVDEAKAYYKDSASPLFLEVGYGFTNFGQIKNPYAFIQKPTDIVAINQDIHAGIGWAFRDALRGEFYMVGDQEVDWGVALEWTQNMDALALHTKLSYLSDNKHLKFVAAPLGGSYYVNMDLQSGSMELNGAWMQTLNAPDYSMRLWSVDASYAFKVLGYDTDVHGWYANNRKTHGNRFSVDTWMNGTLGTRFSKLEYDTSLFRDVWSVGCKVQFMPGIEMSFDFLSSNGEKGPGVLNGREDTADYNLFSTTFTASF